MFKKKSVVNKHVIDMQMDSTTPPDSVFHLFVLLCTLIVSCQFAHAFPITDRTKYIYLFILWLFHTIYMHIPYYMD